MTTDREQIPRSIAQALVAFLERLGSSSSSVHARPARGRSPKHSRRSFEGRIISLDDASARSAATTDPQGFVADLTLPCAIDEIQRAPDLMLAI